MESPRTLSDLDGGSLGPQAIRDDQRPDRRVWDARTRQLLRSLEMPRVAGDAPLGGALAFTRDGHTLLTGSVDATIDLWDTATGRLTRTISLTGKLTSDIDPTASRLGVNDDWQSRRSRSLISTSKPVLHRVSIRRMWP